MKTVKVNRLYEAGRKREDIATSRKQYVNSL